MTEQSMTIKEMQARFAGEWILVADPQTNTELNMGAVQEGQASLERTQRGKAATGNDRIMTGQNH
jgi:hypothetical protein